MTGDGLIDDETEPILNWHKLIDGQREDSAAKIFVLFHLLKRKASLEKELKRAERIGNV
jgi:hypothetical protein